MFRVALSVSTLSIGALLLTACADGTDGGSAAAASVPNLRPARAHRIESLALHDRFVRQVGAGRQLRVVDPVVPWVSEGGRHLIGGTVKIPVSPPVRLTNQRLPATISPNRNAPPGTPTLYRYVRMSAAGVGELEVAVDLARRRAVRIEPSGDGYKITKLELIGPPPKNSAAYVPEPGD